MSRPRNAIRPKKYQTTLYLYPGRHDALIAYLEANNGLSLAQKLIVAAQAALTGGVLLLEDTEQNAEDEILDDLAALLL